MARPREYDPAPLTLALANTEATQALDELIVLRIIGAIDKTLGEAVTVLQRHGAEEVNPQVLRLAVVRRLTEILHGYTSLQAAEALAEGMPRVGIADGLGWASGSTIRKNLGDLDALVQARRQATRTGEPVTVDLAGAKYQLMPQ